jgi:PPOX class probable F420-dependent enzyme
MPVAQLSPSQVQTLSSARIGHLATADQSGSPHVIPVCFAFNGTAIYSVLDQKPKRASLTRLRRVRNIQTNPQVSLVVDHYEEDWQRLWYILVSGEAELILEGKEQEGAVELLRQKYRQYRDMDIDQNPVIKIIPTRVVTWCAGT